jgi:hypothetical protein
MGKRQFRQGTSRLCRVLCAALLEEGKNPSVLHRRLSSDGYEIALDTVYKYCAGSRVPGPEFMVWASACIRPTREDADALCDALMHAHFSDLIADLTDRVDQARSIRYD